MHGTEVLVAAAAVNAVDSKRHEPVTVVVDEALLDKIHNFIII